MAPLRLWAALLLAAAGLRAEAPFLGSVARVSRANSLIQEGKVLEAIDDAQQALSQLVETLGPDNARAAMARRNLGIALWQARRLGEAELELTRALESLQRSQAPLAWQERVTLDLGCLSGEQGNALKAAALLAPLAEGKTPESLEAAPKAVLALALAGAEQRAKGLFLRKISGAPTVQAWELRLAWAQALGRLGQWKESEEQVRLAAVEGEKIFGAGQPALAPAWELCAEAIEAQGDAAKAKPYWQKALETRSRYAGLLTLASLPHQRAKARILGKLGQAAEAAALSKSLDEFEMKSFGKLITSK